MSQVTIESIMFIDKTQIEGQGSVLPSWSFNYEVIVWGSETIGVSIQYEETGNDDAADAAYDISIISGGDCVSPMQVARAALAAVEFHEDSKVAADLRVSG